MNIINLVQGTPEWHAHRASHFNASDAPAMLGISPYKSRTKLLHEMATGITAEIDSATQRRFDDGHRFEALARPLAEQIVGDDLYPVVGSEGKLSASFDGLTMDNKICFEHKTLNANLRAAMQNEEIPEQYIAQMEQQLMLSGAERCLFMASHFDGNDVLEEEAHCWYVSDQSMRERILQGWSQFAIDLEEYKRKLATGEIEHPKEMPKAEVTIDLPALFVHAKGEITTHNMDEFGIALTNKLAEVRAIALVSDQDFSNAKEAAKKFRETAKAIALSKEQMLAQTETIGEAARKMDAWVKDLQSTALQLEKNVEKEDLAKKTAMVNAAALEFGDHIESLEAEVRPIKLNATCPDFASAIKGKRNYSSMQDAVDTMLSQAKSAASAQAKDVFSKLAWCKENAAGQSALFPDLQQIIIKPMDDFTLLITSRIEKQKADEAARLEAERKRIQQEEESKARAKVEAEAAAKLEEENTLIESLWKEARRIEFNSVQYIEKAITTFETCAKDWENDSRPRVAQAVAEARKEMQENLAIAKAEAQAKIDAETAAALAAESAKNGTQQNNHQSEAVTHDGARTAVVHTESAAPSAVVTAIAPAQTKRPPTKMQLVEAVAKEFNVSVCTADEWLMRAFSQQREAA